MGEGGWGAPRGPGTGVGGTGRPGDRGPAIAARYSKFLSYFNHFFFTIEGIFAFSGGAVVTMGRTKVGRS